MNSEVSKNSLSGIDDVIASIRNKRLIHVLGWQDVATRYRRSRVGAFWITLNTVIMIAALGFVFGWLYGQPLTDFLPYLAIGLIFWNFISTVIIEGCASFISAEGIILQVKMPLFVHVARVLWRNLIILLHNIILIPIFFLLFLKPITLVALLSIPALFLVVLNLAWIILLLSLICTRYRSMGPVIQNVMQVSFYLTPIFWSDKLLSGHIGSWIINLNPFYHFITIIRNPILGEIPALSHWLYCAAMLIIGWFIALFLFGKCYKKIAYWL